MYIEPAAAVSVNNELIVARAEAMAAEEAVLWSLTASIVEHVDQLRAVLEVVVWLDVICARCGAVMNHRCARVTRQRAVRCANSAASVSRAHHVRFAASTAHVRLGAVPGRAASSMRWRLSVLIERAALLLRPLHAWPCLAARSVPAAHDVRCFGATRAEGWWARQGKLSGATVSSGAGTAADAWQSRRLVVQGTAWRAGTGTPLG